MSLICACDPGDFTAEFLSSAGCEDVGVPVKLILQKTKNGSSLNTITPEDVILEATWTDGAGGGTGLLEVSDGTTCVITPIIHAGEISGGEKREYGGGNATFGGIPLVRGSESMDFSGEFLRLPQDVIDSLKGFMCHDGNLSAFFVHENGDIGVLVDDLASPTTVRGIPIRSFYVGDKMFGQRDGIDKNMISFKLEEGWSDLYRTYTPNDFDALTLQKYVA